MLKKIMQSKVMQIIIGSFIAAYMVLVKYSTRWKVEGFEPMESIVGNGKGLIALTWHSRFLMLNSAWKKKWQHPHVLISRSRDGEIVAQTCRFLGLSVIRGSTKNKKNLTKAKGGSQAGMDIVTTLENGGCVVITPDGPRGPRQRLQIGALRLARMTGYPIVPCLFCVKNRKQFNSWDKFIFPLPFGRGIISWGAPRYIAEDTSDEALELIRVQMEMEMNARLSMGDKRLGHDPITPAPIKNAPVKKKLS